MIKMLIGLIIGLIIAANTNFESIFTLKSIFQTGKSIVNTSIDNGKQLVDSVKTVNK